MKSPDYSRYSIDELRDAKRHVDSNSYPERLDEINAELQRRALNEPQAVDAKEQRKLRPTHLALTRHTVAIYLVASGAISLAGVLDVATWPRSTIGTTAFGVMIVAYGGMIVGGASLWPRWIPGIIVGAVATLIQVPLLQIGRVAYAISSVPSLELKVWPRTGFSFATANVFTVWVSDSAQPFYLGVNIMACVFTWAMVHYGMRRLAASRRIRSKETAG